MSFGFLSLIAPVAVSGEGVVAPSGADGGAGDFEAVLATVSDASEGPSGEAPAKEEPSLGDTDRVEDGPSTVLPTGLLAPVVVLQTQPLDTTPEAEVTAGGASTTPPAPAPADVPSPEIAPDSNRLASAPTPEIPVDAAPDATAPASTPVVSPEKVAPEATPLPRSGAPTPSVPSASSEPQATKILEPAAPRDAGSRTEAQPSGSAPKLETASRGTADVSPRETSPAIVTGSADRDPVELGVPAKGEDKQPSPSPQAPATPQPTAAPAPVVSRVGSKTEPASNAPGTEESSEVEIKGVEPDVTSSEETPPLPSDPHDHLQRSERFDRSERALSSAHAATRPEEDANAKQASQEPSVSSSADVPERSRTASVTVAAATAPQSPLAELVDAPVEPLSPSTTPPEHAGASQDRAPANTSLLSRVSIETTAQIAAQIVRRLEGRSTRFEMALTPEDLGRVDVSMEVGADGALTARLAFDNPAAAAELRGRADELRRQLQDAGFQLAQDSLQFSQRDGSQSRREFDRRPDRAFSGAARLAAEADAAAPIAARWTPLSLAPRGVDLKV